MIASEHDLQLLTADNIYDDLDRHYTEARASYVEAPETELEHWLREQGIEPRAADKSVIENGYIPHRLQKVVHEELEWYRFAVLVCHRRWGKTVLAVNALCDAAVRHKPVLGKPGRFAYICPQLRQAKQVAWMYLKAFAARVDGAKKHEGELYVEFPNGSRITLYGATLGQADAMRGLYLDGAVFDEPAQMGREVYSEIVRPALADHEGWVLFIGTPHGVDAFSERFDLAVKLDDWIAFKFPVDETIDDLVTHEGAPILTRAEVEKIRQELSDNAFAQEMLCSFEASTDDAIISITIISESMQRQTPHENYLKGAECVVGIDSAWMGDDKTAVAVRRGLHMYPVKTFDRDHHDEITSYLMQIRREHQPDAWFFDEAYGEAVYDRMRMYGVDMIPISFGGNPLDETQYYNRVTEMYFRCLHWLKAGGVLPEDHQLKAELAAVCYEMANRKGYDVRKRKPKELIREKLGRSPDKADAVVLTFAEQVIPREKREEFSHIEVSSGGYHPHRKLRRSS